MGSAYIPDRGDLVWLEFGPQAGHEQAGHRAALVLSPAAYNGRTGLLLCCPLTTREKGYPFEVPVPETSGVQGVVLSDQVKCLDWRARNAQQKGWVEPSVVQEVAARLKALLP